MIGHLWSPVMVLEANPSLGLVLVLNCTLQGFARASSYLEQANSSTQPPQGQGCRWPGGSLPGLADQTAALEEV